MTSRGPWQCANGDMLVTTRYSTGWRISATLLRGGTFVFDGEEWLRIDPSTGEVLARVVPFMGIAVEEPIEREGFFPKSPEATE